MQADQRVKMPEWTILASQSSGIREMSGYDARGSLAYRRHQTTDDEKAAGWSARSAIYWKTFSSAAPAPACRDDGAAATRQRQERCVLITPKQRVPALPDGSSTVSVVQGTGCLSKRSPR